MSELDKLSIVKENLKNLLQGYARQDAGRLNFLISTNWQQKAIDEQKIREGLLLKSLTDDELSLIAKGEINLSELAKNL